MPTRTTAEWVDLLLAADILFGEVKGPNDLLEDPHLEAMGMFPVVDHPSEGKIRLLGFPISFSANAVPVAAPAAAARRAWAGRAARPRLRSRCNCGDGLTAAPTPDAPAPDTQPAPRPRRPPPL